MSPTPARHHEEAARLDAADPLAFARARFHAPEGVVYLDGNSLGVLPRATPGRLAEVVEAQWGRGLIGSWNEADWMDLPRRVGERIAALIGADPAGVRAGDSTSVVLFKLAAAALDLRPGRSEVLTSADNFPTDVYVLEDLCRRTGRRLVTAPPEEVEGRITERTALVSLTHVDYRTGRIFDLPGLTGAAHQRGALTLWDLSHSAGALEVDFAASGADLAVGCGYKHLNGGPGAPAYMVAAPRLLGELRQPIPGWMGHARPFAFDLGYEPAAGGDRLLSGTPSVIALAALEEGLKTFDGVSISAVRAKGAALGRLFQEQVAERLPGAFAFASPEDPRARGAHLSLGHPQAYAIMQALIARGVVGDFRAPDLARFGFTALTLRYADVALAVDRLAEVMDEEAWRDPRHQARRRVT